MPSNYTIVGGADASMPSSVPSNTTGSPSITANDTVQTTKTGTANVSVSAAGLDHFDVSAPASATAGSAFSATVTAKDAFNNTITGYTGTVHFTSSDGAAVLPSNYTFVGGDNGSKTFSVTLKTASAQS